jgi:hypothetical protein
MAAAGAREGAMDYARGTGPWGTGNRTRLCASRLDGASPLTAGTPMKKLNVTIRLEMSVPDDWELVETSEGGLVVKLPNQQYLDLAIEPLFSEDPEETWSTTEDEGVLNDIMDMIDVEDVLYEFVTH